MLCPLGSFSVPPAYVDIINCDFGFVVVVVVKYSRTVLKQVACMRLRVYFLLCATGVR